MDWTPCAGCGQITVESVYPCVFCGDRALFCSPDCCWDNYEEHLDDGCQAYEEQREAIRSRVQATPHSVFDAAVFALIERDRALCKALFERFRNGELVYGHGCLVLRVQDARELCTLLNNAQDPADVIDKLSVFETCARLMKGTKRGRQVSDVRMVMCASASDSSGEVETNKAACNQFLYCVLSKGKTMTRIFAVHPLSWATAH